MEDQQCRIQGNIEGEMKFVKCFSFIVQNNIVKHISTAAYWRGKTVCYYDYLKERGLTVQIDT